MKNEIEQKEKEKWNILMKDLSSTRSEQNRLLTEIFINKFKDRFIS